MTSVRIATKVHKAVSTICLRTTKKGATTIPLLIGKDMFILGHFQQTVGKYMSPAAWREVEDLGFELRQLRSEVWGRVSGLGFGFRV